MANYDRLDYNGLLYFWQKLKTILSGKADSSDVPTKVSDLTNDTGFITSADLPTKVSDLTNDTGFITSADLPTKVSDLTNDSGFITSSDIPSNVSSFTNDADYQSGTQVSTAINTAIAGITQIDFVRVASYADLPQTGTKGVIYLVPNSGSGTNIYDEYIWCSNGATPAVYGYEKIGTTDVDLSGYVQASEMSTISNAQIDTIVAS